MNFKLFIEFSNERSKVEGMMVNISKKLALLEITLSGNNKSQVMTPNGGLLINRQYQ